MKKSVNFFCRTILSYEKVESVRDFGKKIVDVTLDAVFEREKKFSQPKKTARIFGRFIF